MIVTHPVTLERFVVLNNSSCDVSMFLNHFTQEFLSGDENADQLRLDQETVSALLKSMDTEYDRSISRRVSCLKKSRHLVTAVTPAVLPKKNGGQKTTFLPRRSNRTEGCCRCCCRKIAAASLS